MTSQPEKINIRGVNFDNVTMEEAFTVAMRFIRGDKLHALFTPNSEIVQGCIENPDDFKIINFASLIIPDGIGVVYASKILKRPLKTKVAGVELAEKIVEAISKEGFGLYILGGGKATETRKSVAEIAAEKLKEKYHGLIISGTRDGYFTDADNDTIVEDINRSGAKVLFVCLGAPRQEKWIYRNKDKLKVSLAAGLGGSVDVFSGTAKRAPAFFVKTNLEWFYRLCKNPSRIGRMMRLPKFLFGTMFSNK